MESDSEINLNRTDTTLLILATKSREAIMKSVLRFWYKVLSTDLFYSSCEWLDTTYIQSVLLCFSYSEDQRNEGSSQHLI